MQGTVGYAIIALGAIVGFFGTTRAERVVTGEHAREPMRAALRNTWLSVAVIALAVGAYFVLRSQHHGVLGLRVCVGVLAVNAIVVAIFKARAGKRHLAAAAARYTRYSVLEAAGYILVFAGIYLYLTR